MTQKTILNATHRALGAKMVDFGGWDMPLNYGSQIEEHHQVRRDAGMFDVSHMTVVDLHGARTREFLRHLLANSVDKLTRSGQGALLVHAQRAGRRHRRSDRLFPDRGFLPRRRQRVDARQGSGLDREAGQGVRRESHRARGSFDDRGAGSERAREGARPSQRGRARQGGEARQVRRRRRRRPLHRAHRLHRRGRLRDHRAGSATPCRCGTA